MKRYSGKVGIMERVFFLPFTIIYGSIILGAYLLDWIFRPRRTRTCVSCRYYDAGSPYAGYDQRCRSSGEWAEPDGTCAKYRP